MVKRDGVIFEKIPRAKLVFGGANLRFLGAKLVFGGASQRFL